jgi:hypothetical protein
MDGSRPTGDGGYQRPSERASHRRPTRPYRRFVSRNARSVSATWR